MKVLINTTYLILLTFHLMSCQSKETTSINNLEVEEVMNTFDSLDVSIFEKKFGKLGVILQIDDLGVFKSNSQEILDNEKNISNTFHSTLLSLNKTYKPKDKILENLDQIFKQHKAEYLILDDSITNDYKQIAQQNEVDEIVKIHIKSGIAQSHENKEINKNLAGQTYIYITVIDGKTQKIKHQETIGGTQFVDNESNQSMEDKLKTAIISSLDQSIKSIEPKS